MKELFCILVIVEVIRLYTFTKILQTVDLSEWILVYISTHLIKVVQPLLQTSKSRLFQDGKSLF